MRKIVENVEDEGLESLLGEPVLIWCECYIYYGILQGVNENDILLKDAKVVYETGEFTERHLKAAEPVADHWCTSG